MYCTRCGTRNDDTNRFCTCCGGAFAVAPPGRPPASVVAAPPAVPPPPPSFAARLPTPLAASGATAFGAPGSRLAAAAVDALVVSVLSGAAQTLLGVEHPVVGLPVTLLVLWLYFAASESSTWGGTPGKRMMGLRVVDREGKGLSFGAASGRFSGKLLAALLFGIGLAMVLFDDERQGMHGAMTESWVVRD